MGNIKQPAKQQASKTLSATGYPDVSSKDFLAAYPAEKNNQRVQVALETAYRQAQTFFKPNILSADLDLFKGGLFMLAHWQFQKTSPLGIIEEHDGDDFLDAQQQDHNKKHILEGVVDTWLQIKNFNLAAFNQVILPPTQACIKL